MKVDLIIHNARQLVTCASNGKAKKGSAMQDVGIIENGAVAVKDGLIESVGESENVLRNFSAEKHIDAERRVVCPAFVDCHTHVVYAGNRLDEFELKIKGADYLEILKAGGGILSTVRHTREASLEKLVKESSKRLDKMLAHGTCTAEVKTGYGLDTETEIKMLQVIQELDRTHAIDLIPTFLPAHAVPPEYKEKADDYVDLICEKMLPRAVAVLAAGKVNFEELESKLPKEKDKYVSFGLYEIPDDRWFSIVQKNAFFVDVFCEKNTFDLEQSQKILEKAQQFGFKLKAHVDEFTNLGGSRMAIELGATSIDHLDAISEEEIKLLEQSNTIGVITPTVNFNFGATHFADTRKMIDQGCAIAVSTDYNPGSAPCPSLPTAMAIACRYQKLLPSEAFNAATINAACALGLGPKLGSIEKRKQADILILDTDDYRQVTYEFGSNMVETVIKNGEIVHRN